METETRTTGQPLLPFTDTHRADTGQSSLLDALEPAMRPCPHCETRMVPAATPAWDTEPCGACKAALRRPDRTDELCQCRLPECGQCTELVDKGLRAERMPRRPL